MKSRALLAVLLFFVSSLNAQIESTRQSAYDYACFRDDIFISGHQRQDKAIAACASLDAREVDAGQTYEVQGGRWQIVFDHAHAQVNISGDAPVAVSSLTAGNELSRFPINSTGTRIYADVPNQNFDEDSIPNDFLGIKFLKTRDADKDTTGTDVITFTLDREAQVCIWLFSHTRGNVPGWIATDGYTLLNPNIAVISTEFGDYTAYCDLKTGSIGLDGNTDDGDDSYFMYLVSIGEPSRQAPPVTIPSAGEYQFVTTTDTVDESTTENDVACVERVNGSSGAASVDVTEGAGSTCTTEDTWTDPTTVSWADGVSGPGDVCVDFDAGAASADCTVDFEFTSESGITASNIKQTTTTTIVDSSADLRAFPGCEGFGCDTAHGRGGSVCRVTNTNDSGAGSLRACLKQTSPRIIIFTVSGTINLQSKIALLGNNSNVAVFGQTAPGDGIAIKSDDGTFTTLGLTSLNKASDGSGDFHDGLFQHLRFRHGMGGWPSNTGQADNLVVVGGTYNVVFDHNSFTWAGDETISIWRGGTHDITFSNNIFAEGAVFCTESPHGQNAGPLLSGGSPGYNITFHHNLFAHNCIRNARVGMTNGGGTKGIQFINNVHYNNSGQNFRFNQYSPYGGTTNAVTVDVINNYFKAGPDGVNTRPFTLRAEDVASHQPISLYLVGSTWREIDDTVHPDNNESDNTEEGTMLILQVGAETATYTERGAAISPQPTFAVTTTSAAQAYTDVVTNEDAGASLPDYDSVDQRLIDAPIDQDAWSLSNIPAPRGTASYPTLSTSGALTDTDSDGIPDNYETSPLGTNSSVFENHAVLDHDTDGYTNIEEWVATCDPSPCAN